MGQETGLPSGNPPQPMRGSALVALQLLVLPPGPSDEYPIKDPEGGVQR